MNMQHMTRRVVVSAVNFTEGGPLTVLRDCLDAAAKCLPDNWEIVALVHDASLVQVPRVRLVPFPQAKSSWAKRLLLEWYGFSKFFRNESVDLWLSLHDVTPFVRSRRQAVYCHNPSPFYKISLREAILDPKFFLFNRFYILLYRILIRRNDWVVVQQNWIRSEFIKRFGSLPVVVARPDVKAKEMHVSSDNPDMKRCFIALYPTLPRIFKNVETVMAAMQQLAVQREANIELRVTLGGDENLYSRWLFSRFKDTKGVRFIGRQTPEQMAQQYREASVVVFPSKLETWGLPITEAKSWGKSLLVADLPYARETVGDYDQAVFLPAMDTNAWANSILGLSYGNFVMTSVKSTPIPEPYAPTWDALWSLLIKDL